MQLLNPIAHNIDPETSHEAAEQHTASGRREYHGQIVLELVKRYPGLTAVELWEMANPQVKAVLKEAQECRRRLSDLNGIKVKQGPARKCSVKGTRQVVWYAVDTVVPLFS